jgi:hypothetical protein
MMGSAMKNLAYPKGGKSGKGKCFYDDIDEIPEDEEQLIKGKEVEEWLLLSSSSIKEEENNKQIKEKSIINSISNADLDRGRGRFAYIVPQQEREESEGKFKYSNFLDPFSAVPKNT